jgi:hypothetical protein
MQKKLAVFDLLSNTDRGRFESLVNAGAVVDSVRDIAATEGQGEGTSALTMQRVVDYRMPAEEDVKAGDAIYAPPMI